MTNNTTVFESMLRNGIGLDPYFFAQNASSNFPPHTIGQKNLDEYRLTLAIAGYNESNIEITIHNEILTVSGQRADIVDTYKVLYGGIAFRDFARSFKLGEYMHVESAVLKDGLLQIDLVRRLPEIMKPRHIAINHTAKKHIGGEPMPLRDATN